MQCPRWHGRSIRTLPSHALDVTIQKEPRTRASSQRVRGLMRSRGLEPPRVAPLVPETSASAIPPRPRRARSVRGSSTVFKPVILRAKHAKRARNRNQESKPGIETRSRNQESKPRVETNSKNADRARGASHRPTCATRMDCPVRGATGDRAPHPCFCACADRTTAPLRHGVTGESLRAKRVCFSTSDHSSSSSPPLFGAGPFLGPASLAARRFSMTRWRISANIAGLSLMNALAFSRPWPMRVVL